MALFVPALHVLITSLGFIFPNQFSLHYVFLYHFCVFYRVLKSKGSPHSITERRVPGLIPVLGSQPAGDVSHKPGGRLPLLSVRPAVTLATLKRVATNFAIWRTEARWVEQFA